jgi:peptidyl-prolyl cis-trans isomerase SurA
VGAKHKSIGWILLASAAAAGQGTVTLDRIAVIVGNHVIKTSDIDRDLRLTAFLNRQPRDRGAMAKKQSAERLIDQELIRDEIANGSYRRPAEQEAESLETQLVGNRFGGSDKALDKELAQYDLTREQLSVRLLWQLTVLRFIDQRFRAGVLVTDADVQQYVQQHMAELRRENPGASSEVLDSKARDILEGDEVNQTFTDWLEQARKRTRIEYKQEAFT